MQKMIGASVLKKGMTLQARHSSRFEMSFEQLQLCSHVSRGKSGSHTSGRSNAASFKRAAKKRNNIRKHK